MEPIVVVLECFLLVSGVLRGGNCSCVHVECLLVTLLISVVPLTASVFMLVGRVVLVRDSNRLSRVRGSQATGWQSFRCYSGALVRHVCR